MKTDDVKTQLMERTPILRAIKHYTYAGKVASINTPHGEAVPMEWGVQTEMEFSPYIPQQERAYAFEIARDKLLNEASTKITYFLGGRQTLKTTRLPAQYKQGNWLFLCSPETFMEIAKAEPFGTEFDWSKNSYTYDGVKLLRHSLPTDIFVHMEQSYVYNLACEFHSEWVDDNRQKLTLYVRGYWLVTTRLAKELDNS